MARLVSRFGLTRYEADEYYRIALDFYGKNDLEKAVQNIDLAIETNPNRAEYYAARGLFRMEDGLLREDIEPDFGNALQRNPYEPLANFGKGVLAFNDEDWQTAEDYLMKAWAAQPERYETLMYLGIIAHRLEDNFKALNWMQQALNTLDAIDKNDRETSRRRRTARNWISEFQKIIKKQQAMSERVAINPNE